MICFVLNFFSKGKKTKMLKKIFEIYSGHSL